MAGMYPDNQTIEVLEKKVVWPGTDPLTGKFTNGGFDGRQAIPPSYIPAETVNLILDNLSELIVSFGGVPNNKHSKQLADLGLARKTEVGELENRVRHLAGLCLARKTEIDELENRVRHLADLGLVHKTEIGELENRVRQIAVGGCGYRVFAKPTAPENICTIVCEAAPHDAHYFVKAAIATNGSVKLINLFIGFSLSGDTVGNVTVHDASSNPIAAVAVSGRTGGVVSITINTGDKCTLWHGTVEGSAADDAAGAVGYKNLVVAGFFAGKLYGVGSNPWVIGDMDYDEDGFVLPPGQPERFKEEKRRGGILS